MIGVSSWSRIYRFTYCRQYPDAATNATLVNATVWSANSTVWPANFTVWPAKFTVWPANFTVWPANATTPIIDNSLALAEQAGRVRVCRVMAIRARV